MARCKSNEWSCLARRKAAPTGTPGAGWDSNIRTSLTNSPLPCSNVLCANHCCLFRIHWVASNEQCGRTPRPVQNQVIIHGPSRPGFGLARQGKDRLSALVSITHPPLLTTRDLSTFLASDLQKDLYPPGCGRSSDFDRMQEASTTIQKGGCPSLWASQIPS